jgi:hydroxypyruvate isomerase
VEIWGWPTKNLAELANTGADFNSMTGYIEGDLLEPDGIQKLLETAEKSIHASNEINCRNLNLHGTGLDDQGQAIRKKTSVAQTEWDTAVGTLTKIAELGAKHNKTFILENLNLLVDHPGTPFALAKDVIKLIETVNHPNLKMNLDLYHAQIGEGNLVELVNHAFPIIGEIQVADVPGRCEPGTGEIYYPRIAEELKKLNYTGVVGLEGWASGDSEVALQVFAKAFA